jgi:hypothetical protein
MTIKIYLDDVKDIPVDRHILFNTNSKEKWEQIKKDIPANKIEMFIKDYDQDKLVADTKKALDEIGFRAWASSDLGKMNNKYGGLSFVYNPEHQDNIDKDGGTLGTPQNKITQFYDYNTVNVKNTKNSYLDTYGFTEKTRLYNYGYVKEFLDSRCKRTMIRSRLGVITAGKQNPVFDTLSWHRDEDIFLNLRINIPITTESNYLFQMIGEKPYHLELGKAYSWDTGMGHRVYHQGETTVDRINFVLGFSPWFDFDKENRCWIQNEFWGKHPFQMLMDGEILSGLELCKLG